MGRTQTGGEKGDLESIRDRLRSLRLQRGWSLHAMADRTGASYAQVQRRLSGETKELPIPWLVRVAEHAHVRLRWLLTGDGPEHPSRSGLHDLLATAVLELADLVRDPDVSESDARARLERVREEVAGR